jgi:hypothetical protein
VLSIICAVFAGMTCWPVTTVSATTPVAQDVRALNPHVFGVGDSLLQQCGQVFGMGWRSVGFAAWPGATSADLIGRLDGSGSGWPDWTVTENSLQEERNWFHEAGSLVISLGTNDVKELTVEQWRANIDWFLMQAHGRPVLWFTIHNPVFPAAAQLFNDELRAAAERAPNLTLLDWDGWAQAHPGALLPDQVHLATFDDGCRQGQNQLIQRAAPEYPNTVEQLEAQAAGRG